MTLHTRIIDFFIGLLLDVSRLQGVEVLIAPGGHGGSYGMLDGIDFVQMLNANELTLR